jgi:hypothetical protein
MRFGDKRRRELIADAVSAIEHASDTHAPRVSVVAAGLYASGWALIPTATGNHSHVDGDIMYDVVNVVGVYVHRDRLWAVCVWLRTHWMPFALRWCEMRGVAV